MADVQRVHDKIHDDLVRIELGKATIEDVANERRMTLQAVRSTLYQWRKAKALAVPSLVSMADVVAALILVADGSTVERAAQATAPCGHNSMIDAGLVRLLSTRYAKRLAAIASASTPCERAEARIALQCALWKAYGTHTEGGRMLRIRRKESEQ